MYTCFFTGDSSSGFLISFDITQKDPDGYFHKFSLFDEDLIAKFFSRKVFSMLLHEGLINLELVQKILSWRHTRFNVHSQVRVRDR